PPALSPRREVLVRVGNSLVELVPGLVLGGFRTGVSRLPEVRPEGEPLLGRLEAVHVAKLIVRRDIPEDLELGLGIQRDGCRRLLHDEALLPPDRDGLLSFWRLE